MLDRRSEIASVIYHTIINGIDIGRRGGVVTVVERLSSLVDDNKRAMAWKVTVRSL